VDICSWSHNFPPHPGGLEVIVDALAQEFSRSGHASRVVSSQWRGAERLERRSGAEVRRLPSLHFLERLDVPYPIPLGPGLLSATRWAASADLHLAHGALYPTTWLAKRVAKRSTAPYVITEHVGFVDYSNPLVNAVQHAAWATIGRFTTAGAAALVAYNGRVRQWLEKRTGKSVALIRNGVDLERFAPADGRAKTELREALGLPTDTVLGLFVGRAAAKKNLDALLEARGSDFRLVCCGAVDRTLPAGTLDLGLVPYWRMPEVYAAVDFLAHLGVGEGFPVAIQEAASSGLPILLLWDPGYEETISRASVLAIDDLSSLSVALRELAGGAELRRSLGREARRWAETSGSWTATAQAYLRLFAGCFDRS
jgi:glycosyltransferase involved in cell wall biosynthesis